MAARSDGQVKKYATYRDLEQYLGDYANSYDPTWPEVGMWVYEASRAADVQAWRIRNARIILPDHEGGSRGKWDARREMTRGGKFVVWVKYVGVDKTRKKGGKK